MSDIVRHSGAAEISAYAAAQFRTMLGGLRNGDAVKVLGALVEIDAASWASIRWRLQDAGVEASRLDQLAARVGM